MWHLSGPPFGLQPVKITTASFPVLICCRASGTSLPLHQTRKLRIKMRRTQQHDTTPVQAMGSCSDVLRRKGSKATSPPLLFASLEEAVLTDMVLCCCSWSCRPRTAQARGNGMPLCCSGTRTHRSKQDLPGELWCSGTWKQLGLAINHWLLATPRDERQKSPTYDRFLLI